MNESEPIEYRIKRNRQVMFSLGSLVLISAAAICFVLSGVGGTQQLLSYSSGLVLAFIAWLLSLAANGMGKSGYSRTICEKITRSEFSDPPLDDWETDLEEKGAFATQERDDQGVRVADD